MSEPLRHAGPYSLGRGSDAAPTSTTRGSSTDQPFAEVEVEVEVEVVGATESLRRWEGNVM